MVQLFPHDHMQALCIHDHIYRPDSTQLTLTNTLHMIAYMLLLIVSSYSGVYSNSGVYSISILYSI